MAEKKKTAAPTEESPRKGLFSVFDEVDKALGPGDLVNLDIETGDNKFRVINDGSPMLILKHWDIPQSGEATVVPCLKSIPMADIPKFIADPEKYLDSREDCPFCDHEKKYGNGGELGLGKDNSFFNKKRHWVFNVVQDGVVKVAEFHQRSILKAISDFEKHPEWSKLMPNGLQDREIILTKTDEKGRVSYAVGGSPISGPLSDEELENYRKQALDLAKIKAPPTDEAKIAELVKKAPEPKEGDKPRKAR